MNPTLHQSRLAVPLIFLLFFSLLVAPSGATRATQGTANAAQEASRAKSSETLKFTVTVTDEKGLPVSGLTQDAFAVFEGKTGREISYFNGDETPASAGILIDVSGSMRPETIHAAKLITARFIQQSHPDNEYFIGEFNNTWRELAGWTRDTRAIVEGLRKAGTMTKPKEGAKQKPTPYGQTALYDACLAALDKLAHGTHPKHVLLIITDGWQDNASTHKLRELQNLIKTSDVLIYAICLPSTSPIPPSWNQDALYELTALSGGRAYFPDKDKGVNEVIDLLASELRGQYDIGFSPTNAAQGGKWNKIKIKVTPPVKQTKHIYVRSREGYVSPAVTPAP